MFTTLHRCKIVSANAIRRTIVIDTGVDHPLITLPVGAKIVVLPESNWKDLADKPAEVAEVQGSAVLIVILPEGADKPWSLEPE